MQRLRAHGTRALSNTDAATIIATQAKRSIHVRDLTVDQLKARSAAGLPAAFAASHAATGDDVRACRYDEVTTSTSLGGRPAPLKTSLANMPPNGNRQTR